MTMNWSSADAKSRQQSKATGTKAKQSVPWRALLGVESTKRRLLTEHIRNKNRGREPTSEELAAARSGRCPKVLL